MLLQEHYQYYYFKLSYLVRERVELAHKYVFMFTELVAVVTCQHSMGSCTVFTAWGWDYPLRGGDAIT